ncbi:Anti-sigma-E factor RseA [Corynebacterium occultum]|uniref:Anti-sigma-E factor RseA n=1 Tax=Corynebacterium occultum TaxID=2675219 RepID=A0A6B8W0H5_9CORY|nr:Anti-sigma-E factor RseA [Corynebacterium occultum]
MMESKQRVKAKGKRFASVDHLGPEALAAYVDEELSAGATHRARVHLVHCPECRAEVRRQQGAAEAIRESNGFHQLRAPSDLMAKLAGIEKSCPEGPGAEGGVCEPESLLDKIDIMVRLVRRRQG